MKTALTPGGLFEEIGFQYIGPIDGHNLRQLQEVLVRVRELKGPILLHVHTKKGCGYEPAEQYPEKFHGIGRFDEETGEVIRKTESAPAAYTDVFSKALLDCAEKYKNLTAITAAMPSGTGLKAFQKAFPKRCFDVGIAEEHAMTLAAGMPMTRSCMMYACSGFPLRSVWTARGLWERTGRRTTAYSIFPICATCRI